MKNPDQRSGIVLMKKPIRLFNVGGDRVSKQKTKKLSKDAILTEAKQLFSTKGYRGTSLGDLTRSFGVSRPSIYYYYESKMEILSELHSKASTKR